MRITWVAQRKTPPRLRPTGFGVAVGGTGMGFGVAVGGTGVGFGAQPAIRLYAAVRDSPRRVA